jgi:hypothetical protein
MRRGSLRLRLAARERALCHCRMCQKAVGGPFAVIGPVLKTSFRVT